MNRTNIIIIAVILIVLLSLSVIFYYNSCCVQDNGPVYNGTDDTNNDTPFDEITIEDIQEIYPNANITFEEDCEVCNGTDCENIGIPCFSVELPGGSVVKRDSRSGGSIDHVQPPEIYKPCVYYYNETPINGTIEYYNTGCKNPEPVCDEVTERCRACTEPAECFRITLSSIVTGVENQILDIIQYEVIGTGVEGSYIEITERCTVTIDHYQVYSNITSMENCESEILSYIDCYGGECIEIE